MQISHAFLLIAGPKPEAKAGTETKSKAPKSKKKKAKVAKVSHEHRFIPVNPSNYIQTPLKAVTEPDFQPTLIKLTFCSGEGSLPDNFAAHLRMFVCVWESGLDSMADDAVKLLNLAIRDFVKNILTSVLTFKSTYKTRDNGRFKYAIGAPTVNPFLRNSHPLTKYLQDPFSTDTNENGEQAPDIPLPRDLAEHEAMFEVACSSGKRKENFESCETPVNLWHLFHALRTYKSCISSQTVYSVNMERIMMRLSHEDLN